MIKIKILEDSIRNEYTIDITGHAGYAEKGKDIVCSAVSVIFYMVASYLEKQRSNLTDVITDNKSVLYVKEVNFPESFALDIASEGFDMIAKTYPDHVSVERRVLCGKPSERS